METITLANKNGLKLEISTLGATITQLLIPSRNRKNVNVIASLQNIKDYNSQQYIKEGLYLGSTIGRFAGRISKGYFEIDNIKYPIYTKNKVHLHGGKVGFDKKIWTIEDCSQTSAKLSILSPHMEEGYPGNLSVSVTFSVTENNMVKLNYEARTDKTTVLNLTNHSYFNLDGSGTILNHRLQIESDAYLEVDKTLIPTGRVLPVKSSIYDYTELKKIQQPYFKGLDDTFVLGSNSLKATLKSELSGIQMRVYSNQPAMVVFTPPEFPNFNFKGGASYSKFPAICFETQHFPDAPHYSNFPTTFLRPKDTYRQETCFEFIALP